MSNTISFPHSLDKAMRRSVCQARGVPPAVNSQFQIVTAMQPCYGFGTFSGVTATGGGSYSLSPTYNNTWPAIYTQLDEDWTQSDGATQHATTVWSQLVDVGKTVTVTGGGVVVVAYFVIFTINPTGTVLSATYQDNTGSVTGTYTATLSAPVASYATMVASAIALLALQAIPALDPSSNDTKIIYPVSTGSGYMVDTILGATQGAQMVLACANGQPMRPGGSGIDDAAMFGPNITDNGGTSLPSAQIGYIACTKSTWALLGLAPVIRVNIIIYSAPHTKVYAQPLTLDPTTGIPSMGAVVPARAAGSATIFDTDGTVFWPQTVTFLPSDVASNTAGPYGLMGFRSPAV